MTRVLNEYGVSRFDSAVTEWIAFVAGRAGTNRNVVDNFALRCKTAGSWAWIDTLTAHTCSVAIAVSTSGALRTASLFVGVSGVVGDAGAFAVVAIGVRTTWRWVAWIVGTWSFGNWWNTSTLDECVTLVAFIACTYWQMVEHVALSLETTRAWARVSTLLMDASLLTAAILVENTFGSAIGWRADVIC